ncbi:hypothetical protein ACFC0C_33100 [Streptomyces sp. NPDC056178]|uniref:hypothetical protein n=1 Tax=unclassified Streptomyces TaxID=2593676 RepID=UPI0035E1C2C2
MTLAPVLLILLIGVVTALVGAGVLALLLHRPSWCAPLTGALAAMALLATLTGLAIAAARG